MPSYVNVLSPESDMFDFRDEVLGLNLHPLLFKYSPVIVICMMFKCLMIKSKHSGCLLRWDKQTKRQKGSMNARFLQSKHVVERKENNACPF